MIISHEKKFVFIHVPKTGGTSISTWLLKHPFCIKDGNKHATAKEALGYFEEKGWPWAEYKKILVVRNPWARAYSYYRFIMQYHGKKVIYPSWEDEINYVASFKDFNDWVINNPLEECMRHKGEKEIDYYRLYSYKDGYNLIDYPLQQERLSKDWKACCGFLGLNHESLGHHNKSNKLKSYQEVYSEKARKLIESRNSFVIKRFGYSF